MYVKNVDTPILCTVRVHDSEVRVGDLKGTSYDFAEKVQNTPQAVFDLGQFNESNPSFLGSGLADVQAVLCRGTVLRLPDLPDFGALAYRLELNKPVHGITINVGVTLMTPVEAAAYGPPEHTTWPPNIS